MMKTGYIYLYSMKIKWIFQDNVNLNLALADSSEKQLVRTRYGGFRRQKSK
jgi:hypothetical protein